MPRMVGRPTPVRLFAMLALAGAWVLVEWTRTWLFGGFPWMPLAATQCEIKTRSVLQVAAFTGTGGGSFVVVAANIGLAAFAHRLFREGEVGLRRRSPEFLLALFLLLVCLSIHVQEAVNRSQFTVPFARVAFVQPDIPTAVKWDPAKEPEIIRALVSTTLAAAQTRPDLILWPESTLPWALKGGDPSIPLARIDAAVGAQGRRSVDEEVRRGYRRARKGPHAHRRRRHRAARPEACGMVQRRLRHRSPARRPDGLLREAQARPVWRIHPPAARLRMGREIHAPGRRLHPRYGPVASPRSPQGGHDPARGPHLLRGRLPRARAGRGALRGGGPRGLDQRRLVRRGRGRLPARGPLGPPRGRDPPARAPMRQRGLERVDRRIRQRGQGPEERKGKRVFPRHLDRRRDA